MTKPLAPALRSKIVRYILLQWRPDLIAAEVHCHVATVYRIYESLFIYKTPFKPQIRPKGRPRKLCLAAEDSLIQYIEERPWAQQKEMIWFLWEEWGVSTTQQTISNVLKRRRINGKKAQRLGSRRNDELRLQWIADLLGVTAEQLVFVDETLFNETTGWRHRAYAPIGQPARYHADRTRGRSWSVLPAYTIDGYLPCTGIREGWFNGEAFHRWISDELLPHCNAFPGPRSIIVMDNVSSHCNQRIEDVITGFGCQIRYLPPYSPDFNPIELSFSVLKAWVRRFFDDLWPLFKGSFGDFLRYAVARSRCDRFAREHFKHSAGGYIFEADIQALQREIEEGSVQIDFE